MSNDRGVDSYSEDHESDALRVMRYADLKFECRARIGVDENRYIAYKIQDDHGNTVAGSSAQLSDSAEYQPFLILPPSEARSLESKKVHGRTVRLPEGLLEELKDDFRDLPPLSEQPSTDSEDESQSPESEVSYKDKDSEQTSESDDSEIDTESTDTEEEDDSTDSSTLDSESDDSEDDSEPEQDDEGGDDDDGYTGGNFDGLVPK